MPNVTLKIDDQNWDGWTSIRIVRSIKQAANTFDLELTDRWVGQDQARPIRDDSKCQVLIDDELVISGYVFEVSPSYDQGSHSISVSGLSSAADLVDCSTKGQQFSGRNLLQIASALAAPFGIAVTAETDIGGPFAKVALEAGQSIFDFLNELSRIRGVRVVSKADGSIVFIRTGTAVAPTALEFGKNIKSASARFSTSERFSEYRVLGQTSGTDRSYGNNAAHAEALAKDANLRYRPICITADGPANTADCKIRSAAELNRRTGEGQTISYVVQGWRHANGLWEPNVLVDVNDRFFNKSTRLLISQVTFSIDDSGGTVTTLDVAPPQAFDLLPLPEPAAHGNNGGF